jgi:hypothetical protein
MISSELVTAILNNQYRTILSLTRDADNPDFINQQILNLSNRDEFGRNLLHYCAGSHYMIFDVMLQRFQVFYNREQFAQFMNVQDSFGMTPLHSAVIRQEYRNIVTLMNLGADQNKQNSQGLTPLMLSIICAAAPLGNNNIPEVLLSNAQTDVSFVDPNGKTALDIARDLNNIYIVRLLHMRMGLAFTPALTTMLAIPPSTTTPRLPAPTVPFDPELRFNTPERRPRGGTEIVTPEAIRISAVPRTTTTTTNRPILGPHTARVSRAPLSRYTDVAYEGDVDSPIVSAVARNSSGSMGI